MSQKIVSSARHRRHSPPSFNAPPYLAESMFNTIENRYMPEPPLPNLRKRRRSASELNEISRPVSKKQRLSPPSGSQTPPAFWDNLSKIWLTKRALRELDRRNIQTASNPAVSPHRQRARPLATQNVLTESKRKCQNVRSSTEYLCCCEPRILKDIKLFARHGGPDLSDLRNVYIADAC